MRFVLNPIGVLRDDLKLQVQAVEHLAETREDGGACHGMSFFQDGVILYASTPFSRRENFTLAHELGHWLIEQTPGLYDWIADQDSPAQVLETVCDRIAQRLLLPESVVDGLSQDGTIRVSQFFELYEQTQASRPTCAIALARRLPGLGAIAIIDRSTRVVSHASVKPHPDHGWPKVFPWPGQTLIEGHALLRLQAGEGFTRRIAWRTPWGAAADFYVDALSDGKRVVVVLADSDIWGIEALPQRTERDFDERPFLKTYCCGTEQWVRGYPCPACNQPFCGVCGKCKCEKAAAREAQCRRCFMRVNSQLLVDGLCEECRP